MRIIPTIFILTVHSISFGQHSEKITTVDFVQILNDNKKEAIFYYNNNWKILREMAQEKGYILSFQVLETPFSEEGPFDLMLITTYTNKEQYDLREPHFTELIEVKGELSLLNEKKPTDIRKILFSKEMVRHWK